MANKTINNLTVTTSAAADDLIPIWRAANSDTRHITKANLMGVTITGGGTLATGGFTLTVGGTSAINGTLSGGGTVATGGFTLTVPATGTASLKGVAVSARAFNNAATSVADSSFTTLTLNSEDYDTDNIHSTSSDTGRMTAPVTGKYLITATCEFAANDTGIRILAIRKNGTSDLAASVSQAMTGGPSTIVSATTVALLSATDYVEMRAWQTSGDPLNVQANTQVMTLTLLSS